MNVIRKPIPGYEGSYSITNTGIVYSDQRTIEKSDGKKQTFKERLKKIFKRNLGTGDICVALNGYPDVNNTRTIRIKTLLMATFPEQYPPIENLENEEWRTISLHPEYQVSSMGRVKRIATHKPIGDTTYRAQEYLLTTFLGGSYHHCVSLKCEVTGKHTTYNVSQLVYGAFIGEIPKGQYLRYHDGDYLNMQLSNLYNSDHPNREHVVMHRDKWGSFKAKPTP